MIQGTKKLFAADLFCGAGGTTTGAEQSGRVEVALAINHWRPAIYTHQENHPHVRHICATIDHVDPRDFVNMKIDLLFASPECIFHSNARGGKPVDDQRRATAWCVPRWVETLRPKWVVIENVREFEDWGPLGRDHRPLKSVKGAIFQAWVEAIRSLGYHVEWKLLNAADFGGATKRVRLFVIARRGRSKQPIPWPKVTHTKENWVPAAAIIDWSRECPSIFTRNRPLADKTLKRIEIGLRKFCSPDVVNPYIVKLRRNATASGIDEPLGTITSGGGHHGVALPFQFKAMGRNPGATKPMTEPLPTIVAVRENHAIVAPFIATYHNGPDGENRSSPVDEPLPTVDTNPRHAVVQPYLVDVNHGDDGKTGNRSSPVTEPLGTVTTKRGKALVQPFLTEFYGTGGARAVQEPLTTVTTKHRHGLAIAHSQPADLKGWYARLRRDHKSEGMRSLIDTMEELGVYDIGFRMLDVDELSAAQGFEPGYYLHGTKAEQIKQIGNSVHTCVARAICEAIA